MFEEMKKGLKDKEVILDEMIEKEIIEPKNRKLMECILEGVYLIGIEDVFRHIKEQIK